MTERVRLGYAADDRISYHRRAANSVGLFAHWFLLLALLGILIAVAALAFGVTMTLRSRRPPILSPDGRFWWDGRSWQPIPPSTDSQPQR